jgi:large subunit ribosomal protein L9
VLTVKARAGTEDRLYGSVTSTDIADAIWKARRLRVDRRKVELDEPIKALGSYKVAITVFNDVRATVKVMVVPAAEGEEGAVEAFEAEPVDDDLV